MKQQSLALPIAQSVQLVSLDTARAALGYDAQTVTDLLEAGRLAFAFNVSAEGADRREIRIWRDSIVAYHEGRTLGHTLAEALEVIVGHSRAEWIPGTQLGIRLTVSRMTLYRWIRDEIVAGVQTNHSVRVSRASLLSFLTNRRIA
jgi:hypothetical protein